MKELVEMLNDLVEKYSIEQKDIEPIANKIGELVGPEVAAELSQDAQPDEGGEFDDIGVEDGEG